MSIKKQLLALAVSACVTTPVWAQVSLIDVYQRAVTNDPAVREAEAQVREEVAEFARAFPVPGITDAVAV